ncbi:MAG: FAD-binding protein [Acidobacteria bacterium]|nr:FAD-binding protein [Acidobacteriota bacterium]
MQTPPFYAAWATPYLHNSSGGLMINENCQVIDIYGEVIPGLYAGGEAAGGGKMSGVPGGVIQGRIAGRNAAAETPWS